MPATLKDEEAKRFESEYQAGTMSDPMREAWERLRPQYVKEPPPETPETPETSAATADPRASSPWYSRAFKSLVTDPVYTEVAEPTMRIGKDLGQKAYERSAFGKKPWYQEPGAGFEKYVPTKEQARTALQVGAPMMVGGALSMFGGPAAIPVATQLGRSRLWNFIQQVGPTAYRAIVTGMTTDMAVRAANLFDSEHYNDPELHGILAGGGELAGVATGAVVNRNAPGLSRKIVEHFGDTPQGATMRETLESRGGEASLGVTSTSPFLRSTGEFLEHAPGGKRLRNIRTSGQQIIDDELQRYSRLFPGDDVSRRTGGMIRRPTERSMLDLETPLTPILPVNRQSTLDAEARLRPHLSMGQQSHLTDVPREVKRRIPEAIEQQQEDINAAFTNLRQVISQQPLDATDLKAFVKPTPLPGGTQAPSLFHQFGAIKSDIARLPNTTTVEQGITLQNTLSKLIDEAHEVVDAAKLQATGGRPPTPRSPHSLVIERELLPEMGNTLDKVNKMLEGRTVDLRSMKTEARSILGQYEKGTMTPQGVIEGQGRTGTPTTEDPHVMVARGLLDKPNFVQFDEAQAILSDFNRLKRHPGVNIGDEAKDAGVRLRELMWGNVQKNIEGEIFKAADKLGPNIGRMFRNAQTLYERGATLYNSPLMLELSRASLDDILTGIVKNERPEDLKALRFVLGEPLFNDVGQMWLKRTENLSKENATKVISPGAVQQSLKELTPIAETELFPHGQVTRLKLQTDRAAAMEQALTTNEPLVYKDLKKVMTRADAQQVGEIRMTQLLERARDPVTGVIDFDAALKAIQDVKSSDLHLEMWNAAQLAQIEERLRQASALKQSLTTKDSLVLQRLKAQAGPSWDMAGEIRLSEIFRNNTDPHGTLNIEKALDDIHALGGSEQILYGNRLGPLKDALRKADAMEKTFTVLDKPEMIMQYRKVVNDSIAWQAVERDVLAPGFRMMPRTPEMPNPSMIDGKHLVDHINEIRRNSKVASALFADQRILDELHHLGETAMVLSKQAHGIPYEGRHFTYLVNFDPHGNPMLLGSPILSGGVAAVGGIMQANRGAAWLLTRPFIVRLLTQGLHTPTLSPQASALVGRLIGELKAEGYDIDQSKPVPLPKVGD